MRDVSKWVREGTGRIWEVGYGQDVDMDDGLFPPGSSLSGAVQSHSHSFSLSDSFVIDEYDGDSDSFAQVSRGVIYCPPDEQRWRAFLLGVVLATTQTRQVEKLRSELTALKRGPKPPGVSGNGYQKHCGIGRAR